MYFRDINYPMLMLRAYIHYDIGPSYKMSFKKTFSWVLVFSAHGLFPSWIHSYWYDGLDVLQAIHRLRGPCRLGILEGAGNFQKVVSAVDGNEVNDAYSPQFKV